MGEKGKDIRLLLVNTVRSGYNGQMMFILKYLRAMDRRGMTIGFACKSEPAPGIREALEALGVRIFVLPARSRRPLAYFIRLTRLIRREGWDIVHVHGNSATVALELLAARLGGAGVRIAHSHNTSTGFPLAHRLLKPLALRLATARMACGAEAGRWLFGDAPFEVVPIAADPAEYAFDPKKRAALRSGAGLSEGDILLAMVGQLTGAKNHAFLLEAFARARVQRPRLRLWLIGSGPLREALEQQAARLGLSEAVGFTGAVQDVPQRLQAADALLLPSLYEGFPNVLVEAQLAGLPALVSDRVTRDCDMTGLLSYLPLEPEAWTQALVQFRPNDRAADSARAAARIAGRGYDIHAAAARLKARYRELL